VKPTPAITVKELRGGEMRRRDISRLLMACAVTPYVVPWVARAQMCAPGSYEKTPAETAAGVKVADSSRCPGDWRRYGADPTGNADSTAAIQAACNADKLAFDSSGGTYLVSATISIPSGTTVRGAGASATQITCANGGISVFATSDARDVTVEKIKVTVTGPSEKAYTAAVRFYKSTNCSCNDCEIIGCNWAGVLINDSTDCTVDHCFFHDFQGSVHDSADVCIYNQSHRNTVKNNRCYGGNWHGISIQDPYNNTLPSNNMVTENAIGQHLAYGLMVYVPTAGDTFNQLIGNKVENIQGSVLGNNSGAGIYVVGAGAGGTTVSDNTVRNCCVQTTQRSLAPAGIGIAGLSSAAAPVSVTGNTVLEMRAHDAILVVSCKGCPVKVTGNTATLPSGNLTGTPIQIDASSNVNVTGNSATRAQETTGRCIFVYANAIAVSNISVVGNSCFGGRFVQIEFSSTAGGSITDVVCTDNIAQGVGGNSNCIRLAGVKNATVSGNKCLART
jgi:parallel beta-helix repeat protein